MLQSSDNVQRLSPNTYAPAKTVTTPVEQATIGRSLVIKGEVRGEESIYIDGQIEGTIHFAEHRVTIGRNGKVTANISAREVVVMGSVKGNIQCTDRVDIRAEGCLTGDVVTQRISVEDGAVLRGSVQIRTTEVKAESKKDKSHNHTQETSTVADPTKSATEEQLAAAAGK
ncbi:MAG: bactofilin family protein [Terriglobales bacterium]